MDNKSNIEQEIIKVIADILEVNIEAIQLSSTFDELEIDSILFIRLVVQCETEFHLLFEDEMLLMSKFPEVHTFVKYVQGRYEVENKDE